MVHSILGASETHTIHSDGVVAVAVAKQTPAFFAECVAAADQDDDDNPENLEDAES